MPGRAGFDKCDFTKWCRYDTWLIEQAAYVLLGKEPPSIGQIEGDESSDGWHLPEEFGYIFDLLLNSVQVKCSTLSPISFEGRQKKQWHVRPRNVVAWAKRKTLDVPDELDRLIAEQIVREPPGITAINTQKWPWGDHETELLQHLAAAAHQWWSSYDPDDPTTAPTNDEVSNWLQERGVSDRTAEIMARILRADGLKAGPRK